MDLFRISRMIELRARRRHQRRASMTKLNGVSAAVRIELSPAALSTLSSRRGPACAPSTCVPCSEIACAQHIVVDPAYMRRPTGLMLCSTLSRANGSTINSVPFSARADVA